MAAAAAALTLAGVFAGVVAASAEAAPSQKKAIWGPVRVGDQSQFPIYADLGVGIYEYGIPWDLVAPTRPASPKNPADPAYRWPEELDFAISEAQKYGMQVAIMLTRAPTWANGGNAPEYAPIRAADYANFAEAAARRYPSVKLWMIWGEPTVSSHWRPFKKKSVPRRYATMLDAAYGALKGVSRSNLVIGGNTITVGQIKPLDFIKRMRLKNGRPPRMDMYGHNPFSPRKPILKSKPRKRGTADTSDLDTLIRWLDTELRDGKRNKRLKVFVSEWTIPTDHAGALFGFWGDRQTVANYLSRALKITRKLKRVYTLGWFYLYDQPPAPGGDEINWGLITWDFIKKPAYFAFKAG